MSEDVKEKNYTIEATEVEGVKVKAIKNSNGDTVFTVSDGFSDAQVDEIVVLCNAHLQHGLRTGVLQMQSDLKRILGIPTPQPTGETIAE